MAVMESGARGEQNPGVPLNLGTTSFWRLGPVAMEHRACAKSPVLFESEVNMSARRKSAQETCEERREESTQQHGERYERLRGNIVHALINSYCCACTCWNGSRTRLTVLQKKCLVPRCSTLRGSATRTAWLQYKRYGTYSATAYCLAAAAPENTQAHVATMDVAIRASCE